MESNNFATGNLTLVHYVTLISRFLLTLISYQTSSSSSVASSRTSSIAPVVAALPRNNRNWAKPASTPVV